MISPESEEMLNERRGLHRTIRHGDALLGGIDIGSTTAKTVILDMDQRPIFTDYRRHDARIRYTISEVFQKVLSDLGDIRIKLNITGSAGMGISERLHIPFTQEVVASAEFAQRYYPDVKTLLDIGGEDSKLIFFDGRGRSDIRMNGNCAGGTGAFIDQMAVLLGVPCDELNSIAAGSEYIHPIASRCGVFAKTDIQALMSRGVSSPDIAASVFNAVALQSLNTLARGFNPRPKILYCGGPLTFLPMLREALTTRMGLAKRDIIIPDRPELFSAMGSALTSGSYSFEVTIREFLKLVESDQPGNSLSDNRELPLFADEREFEKWRKDRFIRVKKVDVKDLDKEDCFIGIDSGSTTTKMVLIDDKGRIGLDYYVYNKGDHVAAVRKGLNYFQETLRQNNVNVSIKGSAATGYGEDFIRTVFGLDMGVVETLAHYRAARHLVGDVSFILDIGGQDMKALFIDNGSVRKIEINEACSSGCGTFLQTFAEILNCPVEEFSEKACHSSSPCDLGSRCTVFMNSRVKQALREGSALEDMAAGLAYSVVRNCLNKVLKIKDLSDLGEKVIVQGGTFLNPSVQRAFERLTRKEVYCPDIAGLMGAYGCALSVRDDYLNNMESAGEVSNLEAIAMVGECRKKLLHCKGCSNQCIVTRLKFDNGKVFYSGNRCERVFSNGGQSGDKGFNLSEYKEELLFEREYVRSDTPTFVIGIPRALNIYENFPFWCTLFVELGFEVRLSSSSNATLYEKGAGTVMSDSICFPAKLVHGHVMDLIEKGVDRIFYPMVVYERPEQKGFNSYNCPIVTGYPAVIKSAVNPLENGGIPFDTPSISFKDLRLLRRSCLEYFSRFNIKRRRFLRAFDRAVEAQRKFKEGLRRKAGDVIKKASREGRQVIMIVDRPYHLDRFINHGVHEMLSQMGMDIITGDSIPPPSDDLTDIQALTQWEYTNRLYNAGKFANNHEGMEVVQLNSFGCGLDAVATDVLSDILRESGKNLTVVRIDEITSPGSIKLRLRTLVESIRFRKTPPREIGDGPRLLPLFMEQDRDRKILVPFFSKFYSPLVESAFADTGYDFKVLPPPDKGSLEIGLRYTNNEICYPAIIVVGDILKALKDGEYDPSRVAVGITQTGAQCRASNYVTLIKRGLLWAGYDIPVVTVHFKGSNLHPQPGFKFSRYDIIKKGLYSLTFADSLSLMYHPLLPREKTRGSAWELVQKYFDLWHMDKESGPEKLLRLLERAVEDFNNLPVNEGDYPRIGLVGEIYAKYNDFCNQNVVDWLALKGVEVEVPSLMNFFTQGLVNVRVDIEKYIERKSLFTPLTNYFERRLRRFFGRVDSVLKKYRYFQPFPEIGDIAKKAESIVDLTNQFGEGWLIPGEIVRMAESGVENILCLQPFGCIANQVIAKGVEKRVRDLYPNLNILFVDLDPNTSEANMFNRLHFLVKSARVTMELN